MQRHQKRVFDFLENIQKNYAKSFLVGNKDGDTWRTYSINEFNSIVNNISKGFLAYGLHKGDRIALMAGNRPEWNFIDFPCNQIGLITVPLYPTLTANDLSFILKNADVKKIFDSPQELFHKIQQCVEKE